MNTVQEILYSLPPYDVPLLSFHACAFNFCSSYINVTKTPSAIADTRVSVTEYIFKIF